MTGHLVIGDLFEMDAGRHGGAMSRRARARRDDRITSDDTGNADAEVAKLPGIEERKFGAHVRRLRRARGLTQERLAERSGLSPDTVRRLEHGFFSPSLSTLSKLCTGLSLARSTLFESFELGDRYLTREFVDLLATRTPREIKQAFRLVQVLLHEGDERKPDELEREADLDAECSCEESAAKHHGLIAKSGSWGVGDEDTE